MWPSKEYDEIFLIHHPEVLQGYGKSPYVKDPEDPFWYVWCRDCSPFGEYVGELYGSKEDAEKAAKKHKDEAR